MFDLISKIFNKYGITSIILAIIIVAVIWIVAHFNAAPGKEISVLWGLVKYTKNDDNTIKTNILITQDNAYNESTENKINNIDSLPPVSLFIKHDITKINEKSTLDSLRTTRKLRKLSTTESGKKVKDIPVNTYFFLLTAWIENYHYDRPLEGIQNLEVFRFKSGNSYLEIHKLFNNELHIICFIDEITANQLCSLDGIISYKATITAEPWEQMKSLLSVPINRVIESEPRDIQISENNKITVLDILVK